MAEYIDRGKIKREVRTLLRDAQVAPKRFFALYLALAWLMRLISFFANGGGSMPDFSNPPGLFVWVLVSLVSLILEAGCWLYCAAVLLGERSEYLTLFDGFSFVGKLILLYLAKMLLVFLWTVPSSMIFGVLVAVYGSEIVLFSLLMFPLLIPPLLALYRYRFAILNLCEAPELGVMETLEMSKRQTFGYKGQLFALDLSFLGWMLLSYFPAIYLYTAVYASLLGYSLPVPGSGLSVALQVLFPVAAGVFYLPQYRSAELRYFEIAKRTSGVSFDSRLRDRGPDDLGGCF